LGKPLADSWLSDGDQVWATTRKQSRADAFADAGLKPIVADITDEKTMPELPQVDTAVIAVGMDRSTHSSVHEVYVEGLKNVLAALPNSTQQIIYISSTGVFGDFSGEWVDENSPTVPKREGGIACLAAEKLLRASPFADRTTIIRMAGLYGGSRVPTRKIIETKQWNKLSPNGYLNLIHVVDAVNVMRKIASLEIKNELFLASDSHPSLRRDYYQFIADHFGLATIPWDLSAQPDPNARSSSSKRISNQKLLAATGLELVYPDFRSGLKEALS
jgi:nucleoside-diphosphate-sugar epimerase